MNADTESIDRQIPVKRTSNIELLRIIAMILIIMHHYAVHGGWNLSTEMTANNVFIQILSVGGKVGVDIFVLITGFFMITANFKLNKLAKLLGQIWFYSLAILLFAFFMGIDTLTTKNIINSVLPLGKTNWFAHTYLLLYLFIPILNPFLRSLSEAKYQKILFIITVIWYVVPTFLPWLDLRPYSLLLFFYLYALGAYIKLHREDFSKNKALHLILLGSVGFVLGNILIDFLIHWKLVSVKHIFYFANDNIFILCIGLGMFLYFLQKKIQYNKTINMIASTTFGIYLIHDSALLRKYFWCDVFGNAEYYNSMWLPLHVLTVVTIIFVVGAIIDYIRIRLVEKPLMRKINSVCDRCQNYLESKAD